MGHQPVSYDAVSLILGFLEGGQVALQACRIFRHGAQVCNGFGQVSLSPGQVCLSLGQVHLSPGQITLGATQVVNQGILAVHQTVQGRQGGLGLLFQSRYPLGRGCEVSLGLGQGLLGQLQVTPGRAGRRDHQEKQ
jgi:hypothetical protein